MIENRVVGKTIMTLRQGRNLTQQQLAAALNVSHQAVSKWETGVSLPDVQMLLALSELFGVTMEQLLNGEIPAERLGTDGGRDGRIRSFVGGVFDELGSFFQTRGASAGTAGVAQEEKETPYTGEAVSEPEGVEKNSGVEIDLEQLLNMAPFMSKSALTQMLKEHCGRLSEAEIARVAPYVDAACLNVLVRNSDGGINTDTLRRIAPFMEKSMVAELLLNSRQKLSASEIAGFAPFVDSACLEELIARSEENFSWDILKRVAPFLKREVVDALTRAAALGERYVRPASEELNKKAANVAKTLDGVSQRIGKGMDKALRKVARFGENVASEVGRAIDERKKDEGKATPHDRRAALRKRALEKAAESGEWAWLSAHISEVTEYGLKEFVIAHAQKQGMKEWIWENMGEHADAAYVNDAIAAGNWAWLESHFELLEQDARARAALAAAEAENWTWLERVADRFEPGLCAGRIAQMAVEAGENMLAVQYARFELDLEQTGRLAEYAAEIGRFDFVEMIRDMLPPGRLFACCRKMAAEQGWSSAIRLVRGVTESCLEELMSAAVDAGDFVALDALDGLEQTIDRAAEDQKQSDSNVTEETEEAGQS